MSALPKADGSATALAADWIAKWYDKVPTLASAVAIILLGWVAARLARGGARRLADQANRLLERSLRRGSLASARIPTSAVSAIGEILFWLVLFFSFAVAARVAGVSLFTTWLDDAVTHFPHVVIGFLIMIVGGIIAARVGAREDASQTLSRRLVQAIIVVVALIVGFQQMGVDMTMPIVLGGILAGATALAFSLAFGLGARSFVSASIAGRALARQLRPGQHVRIGHFEGEVVDVLATHIVLDAEDGQVLVPLSDALELTITIIQTTDSGRPEDD